MYSINTDVTPMPKFTDVSTKFPNHSSVLIGNGSHINHQSDEKLVVCNKPSNSHDPLIQGNFKEKTVEISNCFNLQSTESLSCDTPGRQGDLRRCGNQLFMYRCDDLHPGWYPIQFGTMMLY